MTFGKRAITVLSQSCRFRSCSDSFKKKTTGILYCCSANLQLQNQLYVRNTKRWMSSAHSSLPKEDLKKFLKYLTNAYSNNEDTDFDQLLRQRPIAKLLNERISLFENLENLKELEKDEQLKNLVQEEKVTYETKLQDIDAKLIDLIVENLAGENFDDVILEITAGVGGQEAMLFVKDLLEMYFGHLSYLGYSYDLIEIDDASQGGIRNASVMISGQGVFQRLRHEAGVHRVQRNPVTEKSGRIHTSVVSVAILPQPSEIDIVINPKDLRVDTMKASGAGGQHVNTTNSAVRITHLPTGMVAECQTNRSQIKNRELALAKLRARLYQEKLDKQLKNSSNMRKQQMGMGERNEKIRTYNFNQDRVTDHRLSDGTMHNLKGFLNGGEALDDLHKKLNQSMKEKVLLDIAKDL